MADPLHHAKKRVKQFGGKIQDYIAIESWFDETKEGFHSWQHRALRHHSQGIGECIKQFGPYITNSDGKEVSVKLIGSMHIIEDLGFVPTAQDWLKHLTPDKENMRWMMGGRAKPLSKETT